MKTDPNDAPVKEAPTRKPRTPKTPMEAAEGNVVSAINALESLGSRLFKLNKTELVPDVSEAIATVRKIGEKL